MKTVFVESCIDAINFLCAPWSRLRDNIWITKNQEIDEDLSEDANLNEVERTIAEVAISLFDSESSVKIQDVARLDDNDYERFFLAMKIVRRSSDLSEVTEGDMVRTISYRKMMALAERRGIRSVLFEDIEFPKNPFIKELIPFCGEELKVLAVNEDGSMDLACGADEWTWPREWIAGKSR
ncbi:MAG: hypothetical protein EOP07_15295 [Proteobacteria bacterium]|nr:MAG: hypothetical protein EOP07_15295 [Pseudomonadota bacterium]